MERKIDNSKYVMCAVTDMEYPMKTSEENNITIDLDEGEPS